MEIFRTIEPLSLIAYDKKITSRFFHIRFSDFDVEFHANRVVARIVDDFKICLAVFYLILFFFI